MTSTPALSHYVTPYMSSENIEHHGGVQNFADQRKWLWMWSPVPTVSSITDLSCCPSDHLRYINKEQWIFNACWIRSSPTFYKTKEFYFFFFFLMTAQTIPYSEHYNGKRRMPSLWQLMIGFQPIRGINLHRTFCAVTISNFRFYCLGLLAHFTSIIVLFFSFFFFA